MIPLFWSPEYTLAAEEFDTTRKSGWIVESLQHDPLPGTEIVSPPLSGGNELGQVHDPVYIEAVRTGTPLLQASSQGFRWYPGLWRMACAHTGGLVAAASHAWRNQTNAGSLSSGQHHAGYDYGLGFCTFNGLALAAKTALSLGAQQVLIIDLDAHCAGGTHSLIQGNNYIWQLDIAVSPFDSYTPYWQGTFDYVESADNYLPVLQQRLTELAERSRQFELCLYYAGMDPYENCYLGGLDGITVDILREREELVFSWCREQGIPVAFGIGGGYTSPEFSREQLVSLHRLTLAAAVYYQQSNTDR